MAIQKTATVGNRLVLLSAFVHLSQFHQSQPYIKLCNMMNLRFFGENHKNLLTFTKNFIFCKSGAKSLRRYRFYYIIMNSVRISYPANHP